MSLFSLAIGAVFVLDARGIFAEDDFDAEDLLVLRAGALVMLTMAASAAFWVASTTFLEVGLGTFFVAPVALRAAGFLEGVASGVFSTDDFCTMGC